jgi:hypothetical protein
MKISKELLHYINDGDLHIINENVEHSTDLREVTSIEYMIAHPIAE